jgi:GNAT superfamily N-acetyltransferase
MFKWEKLTKNKLNHLIKLNERRSIFNPLNEDFFKIYDNASFAEQILLRNQVQLLKYIDEFIGYIWVRKYKRRQYQILSLYIPKEIIEAQCDNNYFKEAFRKGTELEYQCEKNNFNFSLLNEVGFKMQEGAVELIKIINSEYGIIVPPGIAFECFLRGIHEEKRCNLQNEIFKNNNREPLTVEDIYYDVTQEYFWDKGSIFIKYRNTYIGYGQIILDDNSPTIVNFGILQEYRSLGYGELLLSYLLNLLYKNGYSDVKLKVNPENHQAYRLYSKLGFIKRREFSNWVLTL